MKLFKKALAIALSVLVFAGVYAGGALAAPEDGAAAPVAIQLNGENIEFPRGVEPYYDRENWRVFVPVRDTFTALGAEVSYDEDTRVITFTRGDVTVVFPRDGTTLEVTAAGVTTTIESDAKPISIDNRVLVPVRFVAQALGCKVGWDSAERTAIIIDPVTYLAGLEEDTYEIFGKIAEIGADVTGNQALAATVDVSESVSNTVASIKIDAISSQTAADMKIDGTITSDDADVLAILGSTGEEVKLEGEMILNVETGFFAVTSEAFNNSPLSGLEGDVWLTADLFALAAQSGVDIQAALDEQSATAAVDVKSIIDSAVYSAIVQVLSSAENPTSIDDFQAFDAAIAAVYGLYGDSGFEETDGVYVSEISISEAGQTVDAKLTIGTGDDGNATSFSMEMEGAVDGETVIKLTANVSATEFDFLFDVNGGDDIGNIKIAFKGSITPTDDEPRTSLPEGAASMDILALVEFLMTPPAEDVE
jgi:hypothetical protein